MSSDASCGKHEALVINNRLCGPDCGVQFEDWPKAEGIFAKRGFKRSNAIQIRSLTTRGMFMRNAKYGIENISTEGLLVTEINFKDGQLEMLSIRMLRQCVRYNRLLVSSPERV